MVIRAVGGGGLIMQMLVLFLGLGLFIRGRSLFSWLIVGFLMALDPNRSCSVIRENGGKREEFICVKGNSGYY